MPADNFRESLYDKVNVRKLPVALTWILAKETCQENKFLVTTREKSTILRLEKAHNSAR